MESLNKGCLLILFLLGMMITSCGRDDLEDIPTDKDEDNVLAFEVSLDPNSVLKVGEPVTFSLMGNAEAVAFYSGTRGNAYEYRNQERFYDIIANLSFKTGKAPENTNGNANTVPNNDCAQLVYSTDFNGEKDSDGKYSYANATGATWIPITGFHIKEKPVGTVSLVNSLEPSGEQDVAGIFSGGKPVYIAWYCTTQASSSRVQFQAQDFDFQYIVTDNPELNPNKLKLNQIGFQWVLNQAAEDDPAKPTINLNENWLRWQGTFDNLNGPLKEGYAITDPLELPKVSAGNDTPVAVSPQWMEDATEYTFTYDKAGQYSVVFVASNTDSNGSEIVRELSVTITE